MTLGLGLKLRLVLVQIDVRREIYTEMRGQCGLRKATFMLWSPTNTKTGAQDGALIKTNTRMECSTMSFAP